MKQCKQFLSAVLALALCLGLAISTSAYDAGNVNDMVKVSAGGLHTAVIDQDGVLWTWGANPYGELGNGTTTHSSEPVRVMDHAVSVSAGGWHTVAIDENGNLWTWGANLYGELGDGTTTDAYKPVKVMEGVVAVSAGYLHTAAIKTDGSLWMWGHNKYGKLGNGTTTDSHVPVKVMDNVAAVTSGYDCTAAIKTDGSLWMWGANNYGQLGNGTTTASDTPVKVMDNVESVSCGGRWGAIAAVKTDGTLWTWGSNYGYTIGNGYHGLSGNGEVQTTPVQVLDKVISVSAGSTSILAVRSDGSLWAWGSNTFGELGNGRTGDVGDDGQVHWPVPAQTAPQKVLDNVLTVSAGGDEDDFGFTIILKTDGSLWGCGYAYSYEENVSLLANINGDKALDYYHSDITIQTVPAQITLSGASMPLGVRLNLNGGTGTSILWVKSGEALAVPTNPTRPGYTFGGWYTDEALTKPWNFNDKVVNVLVLYAKWVPVSSTDATTNKSSQTISLNGKTVTLDAYTLIAANGGDVTYVKLRDIAALLENTGAKFNVDWRSGAIYVTTKSPYTTKNGTELKAISGTDGSYKWNTAPVLFDGETMALEGIVITDGNGGGHTFFKLRDLGSAIGFDVGWSAEQGIFIETN